MSLQYFKNLNYTLANEDTALEVALLPEGVGHVFSVAGSGGRILPLLAKNPKRITCVDVSLEQLYLTELRIESNRALSHSEFLAFWGYPPRSASPEERRDLFSKIQLTKVARKFFLEVFNQKHWFSILYDGRWERTFHRLSQINRKITGVKGSGLFSSLNLEEQHRYLREEFPHKAWSLVLFLLGNAGVFNALLYKGHFPKKNIPQSFYQFYRSAFERLFFQGPARENFFLQLLFFGKVIFAEGCPIECRLDIFNRVKQALSHTEIRYQQGDLLDQACRTDIPIDFFSFSDVPSYFHGDQERHYLQQISPQLGPGAWVVVRNYLRLPQELNTRGYKTVTQDHEAIIRQEKVQMYLTDIYRWVQ